jgi:hypothetical protein
MKWNDKKVKRAALTAFEAAFAGAAPEAGRLIHNIHSTGVEPPPAPYTHRVCMSIHSEGKTCSDLGRVLVFNDPSSRRIPRRTRPMTRSWHGVQRRGSGELPPCPRPPLSPWVRPGRVCLPHHAPYCRPLPLEFHGIKRPVTECLLRPAPRGYLRLLSCTASHDVASIDCQVLHSGTAGALPTSPGQAGGSLSASTRTLIEA